MKTYNLYNNLSLSIIFVFLLSFSGCKSGNSGIYKINKQLNGQQAVVVTAHPVASEIGLDILKEGGNAVDAAIATQFALAVCYPVAGNIGGGGFMIYRTDEGQVTSLDFREKAPLASTETMYQDSLGNIIENLSTVGHLAVGVPGVVDGMEQMFEKYSKLKDWKKLLHPSIEIAENGFQLTINQAKNLNKANKKFRAVNNHLSQFSTTIEWEAGDLFIQKELAKTLTLIRDRGRAGFYEGEVAKQIVDEMAENNGLITQKDLNEYRAIWRDPVRFSYKNYTMYSMPPPSSGGILLAELFHSIDNFPEKIGTSQNVEMMHLMIEAEKRAYADRAKHIGDVDFYPVPLETLTSQNYADSRMSDFDANVATDPEKVQAGEFVESEETTHFSIVDSEGNAVSITTTLNGGYGSHVVVKGAGFILNNEMDDFSAKVGVPNMYGLVGAEANKIEPEKRMLSSMTPTIVEKDNELHIVVGSPGGSTIITSVFQVIMNVIEYDMNAYEAVLAPRFHHQWKPQEVFIEKDSYSSAVLSELKNKGHEIKERGNIGRVELIVNVNGKLEAGADTRGDDSASGY